jgi:hypothetical protein
MAKRLICSKRERSALTRSTISWTSPPTSPPPAARHLSTSGSSSAISAPT